MSLLYNFFGAQPSGQLSIPPTHKMILKQWRRVFQSTCHSIDHQKGLFYFTKPFRNTTQVQLRTSNRPNVSFSLVQIQRVEGNDGKNIPPKGLFNKTFISGCTVFYQVQCALFCIENDAEIFPAHFTWKVAEKGFKMAFMMNKIAMINSCEIIIEK